MKTCFAAVPHGFVFLRRISPPAAPFILAALLLFLPSLFLRAQDRPRAGDYQISGPYHYRNLSVFLLHGEDGITGRKMVTLEEGMVQGFVKVYETGTVNGLEIENLSNDTEVYVQAGDIVKGGRQDRTLGIDMTLLPNSGRVSVASFCVERGRWAKRGEESAAEFASSTTLLASNELRLAVRDAKNQSEVWANVDAMQTTLSKNLGVQVNRLDQGNDSVPVFTIGADGNPIILDESIFSREPVIDTASINAYFRSLENTDDREGEVRASAERLPYQMQYQERIDLNAAVRNGGAGFTTSLQLSLENAELTDEVEEYAAALRGIIDGQEDVIGVAFTINGEMNNADVYGSHDLFVRLWPRLLRAAATEAIAEHNGEEADRIGSIEAVRECFRDAGRADEEREETGGRILTITRRSNKNVLFETREQGEPAWLHRNYMRLE